MGTSAHFVEMHWGPGFAIGVVISLALFGVSCCQVVFYLRSFPKDHRALKLSVLTMFLIDCLHTAGLLGSFWHILVSCHRSTSSGCQLALSWASLMVIIGNYAITLFVQSFYVHRVWIISGKNKLVTGTVVFATSFQIFFGLLSSSAVLNTRNWEVIFHHPVYPVLAAGAGSISDALVTMSITYFLRSGRLQSSRRENYIRQLKIVFVETGLMTFIISVSIVVLLASPHSNIKQYWMWAPGLILTKAYFNSMLAVLNSRRAIRERQQEARGLMYELTTIHNTIIERSTHLNEN